MKSNLTPVHKVSILNKDSVWLDVTNIGEDKNSTIGVESISLKKTKTDFSQECIITISSKYSLNSVVKSGKKYQFDHSLPTDDEKIFGAGGNIDESVGFFRYENGDLAYVMYGYNEEEGNLDPDGFFGYVSKVETINEKKVVITLQNHAYILKRNLYNFSEKGNYKVSDLYKKIIDGYNETFESVYGDRLEDLKSRNKPLYDTLNVSGKLDSKSLLNVSYTIKNYRAENETAAEILDKIKEKYFTKTLIFQIPNGKTYLLAGFLNLLQRQTIEYPEDLSEYLNVSFALKNYDLKYERYGLNDGYIKKRIEEEGGKKDTGDLVSYNVLNKKLNWQEEKDIRVEITFKVNDRDSGSFKDKTFGDKGGESKTVVYFEEKTDEEIKDLSEEYLKEYKYTGYKKGSTVETYGFPTVTPLDEINVIEVYKNGDSVNGNNPFVLIVQRYQVQASELKYTASGLRQTISLGQLLNSNIQSKPDSTEKGIYLKQEDTDRKYVSDGPTNNAIQREEAFEDNSTDYQLLNQIDVELDLIDDSVSKILPNYNKWIEKTNELKSIVYSEGLIGLEYAAGFFTKTVDRTEPSFERVSVVPSLLSPGGTITQTEKLIRELSNGDVLSISEEPVSDITGLYQRVVYYDNRANIAFKNADIDIKEAQSRGINVESRLARFNQTKASYSSTESRVKTVKNFDNEKNNY